VLASVTSSRAASSTRAPAPANAAAMPRPMPLLPPVTTTDAPVSGVNTRAVYAGPQPPVNRVTSGNILLTGPLPDARTADTPARQAAASRA
jgi:hypothetical protein